MKKFKILSIIFACSLLISGCSSKETQKTVKLDQTSSKSTSKSSTKKTSQDVSVEKDEKASDDTVNQQQVTDDRVLVIEKPTKTYKSISSYVDQEFESEKENDNPEIRQAILDDLKKAVEDSQSKDAYEIANKYFMSSISETRLFVSRVKYGYQLNENSLIIHDTKTDGVVEWSILLKMGSREKIVSGFRNQMGHMPLLYCE